VRAAHRHRDPGRDHRVRDPAAPTRQAGGRDRSMDGHDRSGLTETHAGRRGCRREGPSDRSGRRDRHERTREGEAGRRGSGALAARSLRIEAPIPGKQAVGIEIPNKEFNVVALRRILEELDFKASGSTLTFALGRDVAGKAQAVDLAKMPHLLIAGATGSGKSVMVNALITSLLCNATPDDLRLILVDLKRLELAEDNGVPHPLGPVITEPDRAKPGLKWAVNEMEYRYRRFA